MRKKQNLQTVSINNTRIFRVHFLLSVLSPRSITEIEIVTWVDHSTSLYLIDTDGLMANKTSTRETERYCRGLNVVISIFCVVIDEYSLWGAPIPGGNTCLMLSSFLTVSNWNQPLMSNFIYVYMISFKTWTFESYRKLF